MSSSAPIVTAADRGFTWSDEETSILLQLWSDVHAHAQQTTISDGSRKNVNIFEKVSEEMNNMGYFRTTSQCKEKIKRMKREYTVTKQRIQSGQNKKTMRFFELFEQILQGIQSNNSESTMSNLECPDKELTVKNENNVNQAITNLKAPQPQTKNLRKRKQPVEEEKIPNPWSPDVVIVEDEIHPQEPTSKSGLSGFRTNGPPKKAQKVNNSCSSLPFFKTMMNSLSLTFMKYQVESEEKMISKLEELEKERSVMDDRIKKMWFDFEERRQNDEREHELKLMASLQDIIKLKNLTTEQK